MAQNDYQSLFDWLAKEGFNCRDLICQLVERGLQDLIESGVAAHLWADPHERTPERRNQLGRQAQAHPDHPGRRRHDRPAETELIPEVEGALILKPRSRAVSPARRTSTASKRRRLAQD